MHSGVHVVKAQQYEYLELLKLGSNRQHLFRMFDVVQDDAAHTLVHVIP